MNAAGQLSVIIKSKFSYLIHNMLQEFDLPKRALRRPDRRPSSVVASPVREDLSDVSLFLDVLSKPADSALVDELTHIIVNTDIPEEYYARMVGLPPESQQDVHKTLDAWLAGTATSYRLSKASQAEGTGEENDESERWSPAGAMTRLGMIWHYMIKSPIEEVGINTPGYNTGSLKSWGMNEDGIRRFREKARELRSVERVEAVLRGEGKPPSISEKEDWYYFMGSLCMLKVEDAKRKFEEREAL